MKIISDTAEFYLDCETAAAIGKFDGVHLGHRKILDEICRRKKDGLQICVFTFDPAPAVFFGGNDGKELIVLLNFTPVERKAFRLPLPAEGRYTLCFSSVEKRFGAPRVLRKRLYCSEPVESAGRRQSLLVNLPPFAAMIFEKID